MNQEQAQQNNSSTGLAIRSAIGGALMGLANLVPGISGGTMLVAAGIYKQFINAISEVTTFKFKKQSLITLGIVILAAMFIFATLAAPVKNLVVNHRWVTYAIFIGLTLGGVPVVKKLIQKITTGTYISAAIGFMLMAGIAYFQSQSTHTADHSGFLYMFLAGIVGASAMILPGLSGGYLFLVMGVYVPILTGIATFTSAAKNLDTILLMQVGFETILPVGLGVLVGVAVISNLLKYLLAKYESQTLGLLLGLLVGAVVGLYPFQAGVTPKVGDMLKGQIVIQASPPTGATSNELKLYHKKFETGLAYKKSQKPVKAQDYPQAFFTPNLFQIISALCLIIAGYFATSTIAKLSKD